MTHLPVQPLQRFNLSTFLTLATWFVSAGNGFAHRSIGLYVFHSVIVHYAKMAGAKSFSHSHWNLCLCFDYFGTHFLRFGAHLLLDSNCCSSAHLGFSLRDALVRVGLFG